MVKIPETFILGAASSAWQTEGWQGKKEGQDSYLDRWYKEERFGNGPMADATDRQCLSSYCWGYRGCDHASYLYCRGNFDLSTFCFGNESYDQ